MQCASQSLALMAATVPAGLVANASASVAAVPGLISVISVLSILSISSSLVLIYKHLNYYCNPGLQRHVTRLLFMIPIYSLSSLVSVILPDYYVIISAIRDTYEGFVIYSFFYLISQYVSNVQENLVEILSKKSRNIFPPPLCCFRNDPSSPNFYSWTRLGILQYVLIRISTTIVALILETIGIYCSESMDPKFGHFWILILNGLGMSIAMFTLVNFYIVIRSEIGAYRPVLQFFSVKFVIFFGFWQGFMIKMLASSTDYFPGMPRHYTTIYFQNLLTSFEMFLAAIIHWIAFDVSIFKQGREPTLNFASASWDSFYWLDLYHDIIFLFKFIRDAFDFSPIRLNTVLSDDCQDTPLIEQ